MEPLSVLYSRVYISQSVMNSPVDLKVFSCIGFDSFMFDSLWDGSKKKGGIVLIVRLQTNSVLEIMNP